MKTGYVLFEGGYTDWTANLLAENAYANEILLRIESGGTKGVIDPNHEFEFMLMGQRTFDNVTEGMGQAAFDVKYPYGKIIADIEEDKMFHPVLSWTSYGFMEYEFTRPASGYNFRIVSADVKELLEKFKLPPHLFQPAKVIHEITGETRQYYIFIVLLDAIQNAKHYDWRFIEFEMTLFGKDEVLESYPAGTFTSYEDYVKQSNRLQDEKESIGIDTVVKVSVFCFKEEFDVIYAHRDLYFTKEVQKALEDRFGQKMGLEKDNTKIACGIKTDEEYQTFLRSIGR